MRLMQEMDLTIEEIDALTGQAVGWPRSATFRTIDLVGLDILGHVVSNMTQNVQDERSELQISPFFRQMLERKWLGRQDQGWLLQESESRRRQRRRAPRPRLENARISPASEAEIRRARYGEECRRHRRARAHVARHWIVPAALRQSPTRPDTFLWSALSDLWTYSANRIPEISDSVVEIDRAMSLGFNWELGPFELWDAAGVEATVARMKKEGQPVAANVEKLLAAGQKSWYADDPKSASGRKYWELRTGNWEPLKFPKESGRSTVAKKSNGVVKKNSGASLIDIGDGVGCIEFHSKMNALGADIVSLILQTLKPGGAGDDFDAFVITNDAHEFFRRREPDAATDVRAGRRVG